MANVQLPSFNITPTDIDNAGMSELKQHVKSLLNSTIMLTEELTHLLNHLDTRNMTEIDGDILVSGTVTASKILVDKLSAISADMGKLTSGEIYGAYIATRENAYPRAEMSNTNNLFGAYKDVNNYIEIESDYGGVPSLNFITGGQFKARLSTLLGNFMLDAAGSFEINVTGGGTLTLPLFSRIKDFNGNNLGLELDRKALAGISTGGSGSHNHGIPDGTVLMVQGGGTVTYRVAGNHTHEQTS